MAASTTPLSADQEAPRCTCSWADDGNGESGPSLHIAELDPDCPDAEHRKAWREGEEMERADALSRGLGAPDGGEQSMSAPRCPYCDRVMSNREAAEQGACNDCNGGAYEPPRDYAERIRTDDDFAARAAEAYRRGC